MTFVCQRAAVRRGIVLLDVLVYISVLGLVLVLAAMVFDRALTQTAGLRRNISDIERTLKAGERWRSDVRAATGSILVNEVDGQQVMVIPRAGGEITYRVTQREVLRGHEVALAGVKGARLIEERRNAVVGWRWEVELEQRRKGGKVRPLFTFLAAQGGRK